MSENVIEEKIKDAIQLLTINGYIVKRYTKQMKKDSEECTDMSCKGECKDCVGCSCNICIVQ